MIPTQAREFDGRRGRISAVLRCRGVNVWACPCIAHYNFSASLQSCGLSRGAYGSALRTRKDAALDPARTFSPMQPDQRVTPSLETPLSGFHP
ncbi:hypothetical protein [Phocaeicola plebeius]|uniref:hypothetical protein n=1 Tax=Phocaeicola plebeius TaxID=310297 RepID=UPI00307D3FF2